jgi:hypothetical protein
MSVRAFVLLHANELGGRRSERSPTSDQNIHAILGNDIGIKTYREGSFRSRRA